MGSLYLYINHLHFLTVKLEKKLDLRKINIMRDWKTALKEYLESYYKGYLG